MKILRPLVATSAAAACLSFMSSANACSDPSEAWYRDVSDVVFDGVAHCQIEAKTCQIRVTRVLKNSLNVSFERRSIKVDFQNWYADSYAANPEEIIIVCGVPVFEPEQQNFRARFYANLDKESSELIVRKARFRGDAASGERHD